MSDHGHEALFVELEALRARISSLQSEVANLQAENEYLRDRMVEFEKATAVAATYAGNMFFKGVGEERAYGRILPHDAVAAQSPSKAAGGKKKGI
jgi:regulator of replication initiation timing